MKSTYRIISKIRTYWPLGLIISIAAFMASIYFLASDKTLQAFIMKPLSDLTVGEFIFILIILTMFNRSK